MMNKLEQFYQKLLLTKKVFLLYFIVLLILIVAAYHSLNLDFDKEAFELLSNDLLNSFYDNTIRLSLLINALLLSMLSIKEVSSEMKNLNIILYNQVGTSAMYLKKTKVILKISFFMSSLEFIILIVTPYIFYPSYKITLLFLELFIYQSLSAATLAVLCFLMVLICRSYYILVIPVLFVLILFFIQNDITNKFLFKFDYTKSYKYYLDTLVLYFSCLTIIIFLGFLLKERQIK